MTPGTHRLAHQLLIKVLIACGLTTAVFTTGWAGTGAAQLACTQPSPDGCPLDLDGHAAAVLNDPEDAHLWIVSLDTPGALRIRLEGATAPYRLYAYGPDQTLQGLEDADNSALRDLNIPQASTGMYQVWVDSPLGVVTEAPYILNASVASTGGVSSPTTPAPAPFTAEAQSPAPTTTPVGPPPTIKIVFTIDGSGWPSGYVQDLSPSARPVDQRIVEPGKARTFGAGPGAGGTIKVRRDDRVAIETTSPQFSLLMDCGASQNGPIRPCNFTATSPQELPSQLNLVSSDGCLAYLTISGPNNWRAPRPDFPQQRYVGDPLTSMTFECVR